MDDEQLLQTAMVVGRGATRLVRRMHLQRLEHSPAPMQLSVLSYLHRRGPMTPTDLATADRVQPQSLTRTLLVLESEGLISRHPDSTDGRRSLLAITPAGVQVVTDVLRDRSEWLARAMAMQLTSTECELLRLAGELLDRLFETDEAAADVDHPAAAANEKILAAVSKPADVIRGEG